MQIHTEFRENPRKSGQIYFKKKRGNTRKFAEIRTFFKKFRIPSEVKNALPWTPYSLHPRALKICCYCGGLSYDQEELFSDSGETKYYYIN
jgi:hypothetical protein